MKNVYTILAMMLLSSLTATAQVSMDDVAPKTEARAFENEMKTKEVDAEYFSEATYRAERAAIRKERNTISARHEYLSL